VILLCTFLDEVLVNTEDMHALAKELRTKITAKIRHWSGTQVPSEEQEREVKINNLFIQLL
jgi:hypothetical protein